MNQNYDKYMFRYWIGLFLLGIISLAWALIKSYFIQWNIFTINIITLNIYVGLIIGPFIIYFSLKEILYYKKHKKLIHGLDERNVKVLNKAIRNAGFSIFIILMAICYYYPLFYDFNQLLFSVTSISYIILVSMIIFFISFYKYYNQKDL